MIPLTTILDDFFKAADRAGALIQNRLDVIKGQDSQRDADQKREEGDRPPEPKP